MTDPIGNYSEFEAGKKLGLALGKDIILDIIEKRLKHHKKSRVSELPFYELKEIYRRTVKRFELEGIKSVTDHD